MSQVSYKKIKRFLEMSHLSFVVPSAYPFQMKTLPPNIEDNLMIF